MISNYIKALKRLPRRQGHNSSAAHPAEQLISGYFQNTASDRIAGLQPRRSLDDYFFTHLQGSGMKDTSQVLWRFFNFRGQEPKIFMVDQLWMWILDDSKPKMSEDLTSFH